MVTSAKESVKFQNYLRRYSINLFNKTHVYLMKQKIYYKPIVQLPYHCVPACLKMVLSRRDIKSGTQEEIGYDLGLVAPKEKVHLFKKVRTAKKQPASGYGTQVTKRQYSINNFFRKHTIELRERYFSIERVKNPVNHLL